MIKTTAITPLDAPHRVYRRRAQFSLRTLLLAVTAVAVSLSIGMWCWNCYCDSLRSHLLPLFGNEEKLSIVADPSSIDLYVLELRQSVDPCSAQIADYSVSAGPVCLNERARVKLAKTLVNPRTFHFGAVLVDVTPPLIRVRATREGKDVLMDLDLQGGMAILGEEGEYTSETRFVPIHENARKVIHDIVKEALDNKGAPGATDQK